MKEEVKNALHLTEIPTSQGVIHDYTLDWDVVSEGGEDITMKIDSDGDGTFEEIKKLGEVSTIPSWVWIVVAGLCGLLGVFIGAFIVRRRISS